MGSWRGPRSNVVDEPLNHTAVQTKVTGLLEAGRCNDVAVSSALIDVVDCAIGSGLAPGDGEGFSSRALRRHVELSEIQMEYDRLVAQMSIGTSEWKTWRLLAPEQGSDINTLQALLDTCRK